MGTIPVYNVVDYGAIGDGNVANATTNTNAFNAAIAAIHSSGAPGIVYVPTSVGGFVVNNGSITIADHNIVLQGAGGMGSSGGGVGASTIIGLGSGNTIAITGMGCTVRDVSFAPSGAQNGSYLYISQTGAGGSQGQITVSNVHMQSPHLGIALYEPPGGAGGNYWIERLLIEGTVGLGGIDANVAAATVNLRHVIMNNFGGPQPQFGIQARAAGELVICDGTDIVSMGNCLALVPGSNPDGTPQVVDAVFVSDSLFDSGNGAGCVAVVPSGNGFVVMVQFSNVWTSTGSNTTNTNGFHFNALGSTAPFPIQNVGLVNCLGQNFTNNCGVFAAGVNALSVASSTFGGNAIGIDIYPGMSNFILNGNKCGNYTVVGGNSYGIVINTGASDHYVVVGNLLAGNISGALLDGGTGSHKAVANNVS